jgi:ABC-type lipoprotein release transport system permease subunit
MYPEAATGGDNIGLMAGTVLLLCLVAMAASYIAAQRATQFEPVQAIRAC